MSVTLMSAVFYMDMPDLIIQKKDKRYKIKASTAKSVLLALADHANDEGEGAYPSLDLLMLKTAIKGRATIVNCLDALQEQKIIKYVGRSNRNTANYKLNKQKIESSAIELSQMRESQAESSATEPEKSSATEPKPSLKPSLNTTSNEVVYSLENPPSFEGDSWRRGMGLPELKIFRAVTDIWPRKAQAPIIWRVIHEHKFTKEKLLPFWEAWVAKGFNIYNLAWLTEWAVSGKIPKKYQNGKKPDFEDRHKARLERFEQKERA